MEETQEALLNLQELPLPEPVSYLPQTVGWYVLAGLAIFAFLLLVRFLHRRRQANRYRREALVQLKEIERGLENERREAALAAIPVLVKRTVLAFAPREAVATSSGSDWLSYLDSTLDGSSFSEGPGRLLPELSYCAQARLEKISDHEISELLALLHLWIRRHRARV